MENRIEERLTERHAVFEARELRTVTLEQTAGELAPRHALQIADGMIRDRRILTLDPALAPLLGEGEQHGSWLSGAFISSDVGRGWLIQSHTFLPGTLVQNAARRVVAKGLPTDSLEPLLGELGPLVLSVRRLVAGEADEVPVLMAFYGVGLAEGVRLATPWGLLRPAFPYERDQRPFGSFPPSAILETTLPVRWKLGEHGASSSGEFTAMGTHPDLLALTALLALGRGTPLQWL